MVHGLHHGSCKPGQTSESSPATDSTQSAVTITPWASVFSPSRSLPLLPIAMHAPGVAPPSARLAWISLLTSSHTPLAPRSHLARISPPACTTRLVVLSVARGHPRHHPLVAAPGPVLPILRRHAASRTGAITHERRCLMAAPQVVAGLGTILRSTQARALGSPISP